MQKIPEQQQRAGETVSVEEGQLPTLKEAEQMHIRRHYADPEVIRALRPLCSVYPVRTQSAPGQSEGV